MTYIYMRKNDKNVIKTLFILASINALINKPRNIMIKFALLTPCTQFYITAKKHSLVL